MACEMRVDGGAREEADSAGGDSCQEMELGSLEQFEGLGGGGTGRKGGAPAPP